MTLVETALNTDHIESMCQEVIELLKPTKDIELPENFKSLVDEAKVEIKSNGVKAKTPPPPKKTEPPVRKAETPPKKTEPPVRKTEPPLKKKRLIKKAVQSPGAILAHCMHLM